MPREKEIKRKSREPEAKREYREDEYEFPITEKEKKRLIKEYAKRYKVPEHVVRNTVEQRGWRYLIEALQNYQPEKTFKERLIESLSKIFNVKKNEVKKDEKEGA